MGGRICVTTGKAILRESGIMVVVIVLWFVDCSKIGNIGYIVECQWFSRQHFGNMKSNILGKPTNVCCTTGAAQRLLQKTMS